MDRYLLRSAAWVALSPGAAKVYLALASEYKGQNNGSIIFSVAMAAERTGQSKGTTHKALQELQEKGFIVCMMKGSFSYKIRHATEWRLTAYICDKTRQAASKEFARWQPPKLRGQVQQNL